MKDFAEGAAAIGVGLRKGPPPAFGLLEGLSFEPVERAALAELGARDLMRRAGTETEVIDALTPSPDETHRVARAADALAQAFALKAEAAVLEWADAAAGAGFIAPPEALPALLGLPRAARERVRPILGERGLWLAGIMGVDVGKPFLTNSRARLAEWDELDGQERAEAIGALVMDLSPNDEPVLLRALADRRKEVREKATDLLLKLPDSPLSRELALIAEGLIQRSGRARNVLVVETPDPASLPVWLPRTTGWAGLGPRGLALLDVVRHIPPAYWCETTGMSPEGLVAGAEKSDERRFLPGAFEQAAVRYDDQSWIDALFRAGLDFHVTSSQVMGRASDAALESALRDKLGKPNERLDRIYGELLSRDRPLPPELSLVFVERIRQTRTNDYRLRDLATKLDLGVLPMIATSWEDNAGVEPARLHWHTILTLRARLQEGLR